MGDQFEIRDESGDRKYFTIIPNYVLNHSTMWDREVYVQMKRIAGEGGRCHASRLTLAKQCGMSVRRLDKSIKYLLEHDWIYPDGGRIVHTPGGEQMVKVYGIRDLWKKNVEFYESSKGGAHKTPPYIKGGARTASKVVHQVRSKKNKTKEEQEQYIYDPKTKTMRLCKN